MAATATEDWRELAQRSCDGLHVALLWSRSGDRMKITVADVRHADRLEFDVKASQALDAFYDPCIYAPHAAAQAGAMPLRDRVPLVESHVYTVPVVRELPRRAPGTAADSRTTW